MVDRQHKSSSADSVAVEGDAGALELIGAVVPELRNSAFRLEAEGGIPSVDSADVTLPTLRSAPKGGGRVHQEEEEGEQGFRHGCRDC